MTRMKRAALLILAALLVLSLTACKTEKRDPQQIIEEMVVYYGNYGAEANDKVSALLRELRSADRVAAAKWESVMKLWESVSGSLPLNYDVLPDGLDDTDALCIVALGFQLNPDGTMRDELRERLGVVLNSAEKYPNAYIVCTGGGTASNNPSATESGVMAAWLEENGVYPARIIVEDRSVTTAQNAIYTYDILQERGMSASQAADILRNHNG